MDEKTTCTANHDWTWEGKAWLVFWIVLPIVTGCLLLCYPALFELKRGKKNVEAAGTTLLVIAWPAGAVGWLMWYRGRQRTRALEEVSRPLNLSLEPRPTDDDWSAFGVFRFFNIGYAHEARNLIRGRVGDFIASLVDFHFRRSLTPRDMEIPGRTSLVDSRGYHQTVVAFWNVADDLPDFQLVTRESWWSSPMGKNRTPKGCIVDLQIGNDNPEFAGSYKVGGSDAEEVRRFFTPALVAFFVENPGWDVETRAGNILFYQEKRIQKPQNLHHFLEQTRRIALLLRDNIEPVVE